MRRTQPQPTHPNDDVDLDADLSPTVGPVVVPLVVSPKQLASALGVSTTTLWRMRKRHELPDAILIDRKNIRWRVSDIHAWLATRPVAPGETEAARASRLVWQEQKKRERKALNGGE